MIYRADMLVIVNPLNTGYSVDTHGMITITYPNTSMKKQVLLFKALDSGVKCSIVGSSS